LLGGKEYCSSSIQFGNTYGSDVGSVTFFFFFFCEEINTFISKDALNWPKFTVNTSNKCCSHELLFTKKPVFNCDNNKKF